ncbi:MAG TPA: prepilin-type N-terminal cleavage/methylation domain-containing protein [Pyrinomonadaceae bacterium]|jgi:prepilin-type N-terminal cleavage/methylation domain-containing protein
MSSKLARRLSDQQGFNLLELMIVIAIIGLLIGVGAIGWQAANKAGNEAAAAQQMDNIRKYEAQYAGRNHGEFGSFTDLVAKAGLDERFNIEQPVVNGYRFTVTVNKGTASTAASYTVAADPQQADGVMATGNRHFYFDSSLSTIKATDENRTAKADDPSI